jgi:hypothetical protein
MDDPTDGLPGHVLETLRDKAQRVAEDLTVVQLRLQRGTTDPEQRDAQWDDVVAGFYTGDERLDKFLNGFLIVELSELAAWSYLEGRATA